MTQLFFDADQSLGHRRFWRHIVAVRIDTNLFYVVGFFAGQGIKFCDAFKFIAEERQAPRTIIQVGREDFERITAYTE